MDGSWLEFDGGLILAKIIILPLALALWNKGMGLFVMCGIIALTFFFVILLKINFIGEYVRSSRALQICVIIHSWSILLFCMWGIVAMLFSIGGIPAIADMSKW